MKKLFLTLAACCAISCAVQAKTLIVYYSYTNNVERIVTALSSQIEADVIEVEPAEKGLDYAANNYAIGSAQIAAIRNNPNDKSSYPAIDPVEVDMDDYDTVVIGAPLWWSQMAAPLQTFLFDHGKEMAGKNICLIVSSASSGISSVEADVHRLIPDGKFITPSLWIKSSQTSSASSMISDWLKKIGYNDFASDMSVIFTGSDDDLNVYTLSGLALTGLVSSVDELKRGIYIINGKKIAIQ